MRQKRMRGNACNGEDAWRATAPELVRPPGRKSGGRRAGHTGESRAAARSQGGSRGQCQASARAAREGPRVPQLARRSGLAVLRQRPRGASVALVPAQGRTSQRSSWDPWALGPRDGRSERCVFMVGAVVFQMNFGRM